MIGFPDSQRVARDALDELRLIYACAGEIAHCIQDQLLSMRHAATLLNSRIDLGAGQTRMVDNVEGILSAMQHFQSQVHCALLDQATRNREPPR